MMATLGLFKAVANLEVAYQRTGNLSRLRWKPSPVLSHQCVSDASQHFFSEICLSPMITDSGMIIAQSFAKAVSKLRHATERVVTLFPSGVDKWHSRVHDVWAPASWVPSSEIWAGWRQPADRGRHDQWLSRKLQRQEAQGSVEARRAHGRSLMICRCCRR